MDDKTRFFLCYLLFLLIWAIGVFAVSKGLAWSAKYYLKAVAPDESGKGSLRAKLPRYLAFQLILVVSIVFSRNCYIILTMAIYSVALSEFIYQISKSTFRHMARVIWIASGIIAAIVAASSYIYLSYLLAYRTLVFLLFVLSASDTFSQVVGEALRGPLLTPRISPNKTLSGLIGGFTFSILASMSFWYIAKAWDIR